VLATGSCS